MKITRRNTIRNIKSFALVGKELAYLSKEGILNCWGINFNRNIFAFSSDNKACYAYEKEGKGVSTHILKEDSHVKLAYPINSNNIFSDFALVRLKNDVQTRTFSLKIFSLKEKVVTNSLAKRYSFGQSTIEQKVIFYYNLLTGLIEALHLPTETTLWEFDSSQLGVEKVGKILGVFGEVLVVIGEYTKPRLDYQDHFEKIIGLDIKTGELVWESTGFSIGGEQMLFASLLTRWQFSTDGTKLYGMQSNFYHVFNTQDGSCQSYNLEQELEKNGINTPQSNSMENDLLYFRAYANGLKGFRQSIGVFNTETLKIDWVHIFKEFQETGASIKNTEPKVAGNKVYALDSHNTLHIFERD